MTKQVQRRRGTATQHTSFTGAEGELSVNTTNKSVHVHDNVTAGGFEAARVDMDNVTSSSILTAAGITATTTELNYVDGVTSAIQTQIDGKAGTASPTFTGTLTAANLTATGTTTLAGASTSADITFGDNDKAIFGAGSDLQIYHDGSNSYIRENGTGDLLIQASNIQLEDPDGNNYLRGVDGGILQLYHSGTEVMRTTSTGIDVTGRITTDAITEDTSGNVGIGTSSPAEKLSVVHSGDVAIEVKSTGTGDADASLIIDAADTGEAVLEFRQDGAAKASIEWFSAGSPDLNFRTEAGTNGVFDFQPNDTLAMRIDSSGRVGIGTSTPRTGLHLYGAGQTTSAISDAGSLGAFLRVSDTGAAGGAGGGVVFGTNASEADGFAGFAAIKGLLANGNDRTIGALAFSTRASTTDTALTERMRLTSDGKLGIGTSSIASDATVHVDGTDTVLLITEDSEGDATLRLGDTQGNLSQSMSLSYDTGSTNALKFIANGTSERMRIDSSGKILINKTTDSIATAGTVISSSLGVRAAVDGGIGLLINRLTSDGDLIDLRKDGTTVGAIGVDSGDQLFISRSAGSQGIKFKNSGAIPCNANGSDSDNDQDLGISSVRWNDAYITNGVTTGSDGNDKQDIRDLTEAEQRVAVACKGLLKAWRWKSAVEEKGDNARIHCGIIAQDLQAAFAAEGLDAGRYAMFMSNTWTDEETGEERTRMGVRYSELLAFIIAAI